MAFGNEFLVLIILVMSLLYLGFTEKSENHHENNLFYKTTGAFNYPRCPFRELTEGNAFVPMSIFICTYLAEIF